MTNLIELNFLMEEIITFDSLSEELQDFILEAKTRYWDQDRTSDIIDEIIDDIVETAKKYPIVLGSPDDLYANTILLKILINVIKNEHKN